MKENDPATIWNCWSGNLIYDDGEPGYIIHMFDEAAKTGRSLCGVRYQDSGMLNLNEVEPGCIKCRRVLEKRGLLEPD